MKERDISETEVEDTMARPSSVKETKHGRLALVKECAGGAYTVAIIEADDEGLIVVTVLKTNAEGARRYGFTGI